jgi:hypothetical protein
LAPIGPGLFLWTRAKTHSHTLTQMQPTRRIGNNTYTHTAGHTHGGPHTRRATQTDDCPLPHAASLFALSCSHFLTFTSLCQVDAASFTVFPNLGLFIQSTFEREKGSPRPNNNNPMLSLTRSLETAKGKATGSRRHPLFTLVPRERQTRHIRLFHRQTQRENSIRPINRAALKDTPCHPCWTGSRTRRSVLSSPPKNPMPTKELMVMTHWCQA